MRIRSNLSGIVVRFKVGVVLYPVKLPMLPRDVILTPLQTKNSSN